MKYKGETDLNTEMVERVARKYLDSLYRLAITYCRNSEDYGYDEELGCTERENLSSRWQRHLRHF